MAFGKDSKRFKILRCKMEHPEWDQSQIADEVDLEQPTVSRYLKSINEDDELQDMLSLHRERTLMDSVELREEIIKREIEIWKQNKGDDYEGFHIDRLVKHLESYEGLLNVEDLVNELTDAKDERVDVSGTMDVDEDTRELIDDMNWEFNE